MRRACSWILFPILAGFAAAAWPACNGTISLTFDVGNMRDAEQVADILRRNGLRATFFLANNPTYRGDHVLDDAWRGFWRDRVAEGHTFGNHTWSHYYQRSDQGNGSVGAVNSAGKPVTLSRQEFCAELSRVASRFAELTGYRMPGIWRAPGGRLTQNSARWAAECGYPVHVGWSRYGYLRDDVPGERLSAQSIFREAGDKVSAGDIVLMHLGTWARKDDRVVNILEALIQKWKSRGFCFNVIDGTAR